MYEFKKKEQFSSEVMCQFSSKHVLAESTQIRRCYSQWTETIIRHQNGSIECHTSLLLIQCNSIHPSAFITRKLFITVTFIIKQGNTIWSQDIYARVLFYIFREFDNFLKCILIDLLPLKIYFSLQKEREKFP